MRSTNFAITSLPALLACALSLSGCGSNDCFPSCGDGFRCGEHKCRPVGVALKAYCNAGKGTTMCLSNSCAPKDAQSCCPPDGPYSYSGSRSCFSHAYDAAWQGNGQCTACEGAEEVACPAGYGACAGTTFCCPADHPFLGGLSCFESAEDADYNVIHFSSWKYRATCAGQSG